LSDSDFDFEEVRDYLAATAGGTSEGELSFIYEPMEDGESAFEHPPMMWSTTFHRRWRAW